MATAGTSETPVRPIRTMLRRFGDTYVPRGDGTVFLALAGVILFLLVNEALTGVMLALYYRPSVANANDSVRFVLTQVEFGGLVRSLHFWGAHGLIVMLGLTILWALIRRVYRQPNGVGWGAGMIVFFLVLAETFTGGLLPWTHRSVIESQISSTLAGKLPVIGGLLRGLMLGSTGPGDLALVRILGVHAGAIPMMIGVAVAVYALHMGGLARPVRENRTVRLFPDATLRAAAAICLVWMGLLALSAIVSPQLGMSAEVARATAAGVHPSWYFAFVHLLLRASPPEIVGLNSASVISVLLFIGVLIAIIFPLIDRKGSRIGQVVALVFYVFILGGTIRAILG